MAKPRATVCLIHWNADEARECAGILSAAGYRADSPSMQGATSLGPLRVSLPAAYVIDLSRLP